MDKEELKKEIMKTIQLQLPGKNIKSVEDKGIWIKHIFKITFDDDTCAYIKLAVNDMSDILMEANAVDLLLENGIHQPGVIKVDTSCSILPYPYIIQYGGEGKKLSDFIIENNANQLKQIYHAVGEYYRKFADITNDWAGVWDVVPKNKKYPLHPAEAMYKLEIERGSGYRAYSAGVISHGQYEQIKSVWQKNIPMLKERHVSLVHYSPFPWTIYISDVDCNYQVSKITVLGDIVWWDADIVAAHVLYPPFFIIDDNLRRAFLDGYKKEVNNKCISLFCIMHRLCAWAGIYAEPHYNTNSSWRKNCINEIDFFLQYLQ